tara:strand:+ start:630 stop:758 length:129 start_codon:yes stop_codon:yes gene_type:complete
MIEWELEFGKCMNVLDVGALRSNTPTEEIQDLNAEKIHANLS